MKKIALVADTFPPTNTSAAIQLENLSRQLTLDGNKVVVFIPDETIKERIASSDYSRSNWCPGSSVKPMKIHIGDLKKGSHVFSYQIPNAQPTTDKFWNHWNVSYYLTYEN